MSKRMNKKVGLKDKDLPARKAKNVKGGVLCGLLVPAVKPAPIGDIDPGSTSFAFQKVKL